ncbi:hypothetical protein E4P40_12405 [Blastococcus sp. CT_GayMR20]|uniref:hypothetical protein n=1 Tax=Blastococcus sp. CT_GayMR20 TaxID=2559609 RepID=UPI001073E658|nr:hypothetical protein [Blastococcus sp. CT_GayMR20]TFV86719.1 hypothetical protein E4P40_12405 [Blastococcus sp. CT_GayMR20]
MHETISRLPDAPDAHDPAAMAALVDPDYRRHWARLYLGPVEQGGTAIDEAVRHLSGTSG